MGGGNKTISNTTPAIGAVTIQQSSYGLVVPIVWGRTRITGNLIWYGDFKATPHTEVTQSGGKGGGGGIKTETTTYTYSAAVMMALAEGPILGVRGAWRGKEIFDGAATDSKTIKTSETYESTVPMTAHTVTNAADFVSNVSVEYQSPSDEDFKSFRKPYITLVENTDYTVAAGVYTFITLVIPESSTIRITYVYESSESNVSALGQLGLSLANGLTPQDPWGYMVSNHPTQAVGYSGVAYVYGANYALTGNAEVDNHSFEVDAALQFSDEIPDANPADVVADFLSNPIYGAGFGLEFIGDLNDFRDSSTAQGVFVSPALTEQRPAIDFLKDMAQITNMGLVWSENQLKFVPYYDTSMTANGVTYTPDTAPIYDLTDDDFLPNGDDGPVKVTRTTQADAFNRVQIEFHNRANAYNIEVMEAKDQADIENYGLRSMATVQAHAICDKDVARVVAQLLLQRSLYIRNQYEFKLGWNKIGLEPMDLVTISDPGLGLSFQPVRIKTIEESEDGELTFTAEEFPKGSASATLYPSGSGSGFAHNYNVDPGMPFEPAIFEGPSALAAGVDGLEIWLATGGGVNYGGCEIWVSTDGDSYKQAATLIGNSRYGVTTTGIPSHTAPGQFAETVGLELTAGGQLLAGSQVDLDQLTTLIYIDGEYCAYQAAALTGADMYTLGPKLSRGVYLSGQDAHTTGSVFVRCDNAVGKMALTSDYIGKTVYIKLLAFNIYKGALQSLADAVAYPYTITGKQANLPPIAPPHLRLEGPFTINTAKFAWDRVGNAATYNVQMWDTVADVKVREVDVGNALRYDYSSNDAKSDGGPWRALTIKVQGINKNGAAGAFSTLAAVNPQVGALTNVKTTSGVKTIYFTCSKPSDADFAGVMLWISTTPGFAEGDTTLVYDGPNVAYTVSALHDGTLLDASLTYYMKWAGYDTFDKNGLTVGASGPLTATTVVVNQTAIVYLYQWNTVRPMNPIGTSTYFWATGVHSGYTGTATDGWEITLGPNPGVPGLRLWVVQSQVLGTGTSTTIDWSLISNVQAWSQNGSDGLPGVKTARPVAYQWALSAPTAFGSATYTWSSATYDALPAFGWSFTKGNAPGPGYSLFEAAVVLVDSSGATTSFINWTTAAVSAISYAGTNGATGASAAICYTLIDGNTLSTSPTTVTVAGFPATGTWGETRPWQATPPTPSPGQAVFQCDGIFNPVTGQTTWNVPYLSNLKVGSLSAISANIGTITSGTITSGVAYLGTVTADQITSGSINADGGAGTIEIGKTSSAGMMKISRTTGTLTPAFYIYDHPSSFTNSPALYIDSTADTFSGALTVSASAATAGYFESKNSSFNAASFSNTITGTAIALAGVYAAYAPSGKGQANFPDGYLPFTGCHPAVILNEAIYEIGDIMADVAVVYKHDVSNTLTEVAVSTAVKQKAAIGVVAGVLKFDNTLELPYELWWALVHTHHLLAVNSVGEGQVNVCGINGDIEIGDYICTSQVLGKGMKQDEDMLMNYTVAKAREAVKFDSATQVKMIACIYVCG